MAPTNYEQLLKQYLDICNKALIENRNIFPYKHLLQAITNAPPVSIVLVDDTPKGLFELSIDDASIHAKNIGSSAPTEQVIRMNIRDLEDAVQNPDEYIKDPTKFDWHWVRN